MIDRFLCRLGIHLWTYRLVGKSTQMRECITCGAQDIDTGQEGRRKWRKQYRPRQK